MYDKIYYLVSSLGKEVVGRKDGNSITVIKTVFSSDFIDIKISKKIRNNVV